MEFSIINKGSPNLRILQRLKERSGKKIRRWSEPRNEFDKCYNKMSHEARDSKP